MWLRLSPRRFYREALGTRACANQPAPVQDIADLGRMTALCGICMLHGALHPHSVGVVDDRIARRSNRQATVMRRRRIALGSVAAVLIAGGGFAFASGSGGGDPAAPAATPNGASSLGGGPQREVAVQPAVR